jgi:multisubunit Na+/H+ antiporter MnhC subunit
MIYFIITTIIISACAASFATYVVYKMWKDYPDDGGYN